MDFRGSRQALSYHDGITELPSDVLARLMGAVVIHGGSAAAGRLRRTCRFFGRLGGHAAMEQGCRAALAELKGCSDLQWKIRSVIEEFSEVENTASQALLAK